MTQRYKNVQYNIRNINYSFLIIKRLSTRVSNTIAIFKDSMRIASRCLLNKSLNTSHNTCYLTTLYLSRLRRLLHDNTYAHHERAFCRLRCRSWNMEWRTVVVIVLIVSLCFFIVPIKVDFDKTEKDAQLFANYIARYNKSYRNDPAKY